jgi:RES domain-containing protein
MEVFRLVQTEFVGKLTGKGAAIKGGRWNSIGIEMIYTAGNRSLAMAEVAVHFSLGTLPSNFKMMTLEIPSTVSMMSLSEKKLSEGWNSFPPPVNTRQFGDRFILENGVAVLKVPSVVTPGDFNYLINPFHKDISKIRIVSVEDFLFDKRLFKP